VTRREDCAKCQTQNRGWPCFEHFDGPVVTGFSVATGPTVDAGPMPVCPSHDAAFSCPPWETVSLEVSFGEVNPEALGLLTGGVLGTPPEPVFSLTVSGPVKRTFWQWLRRRPKRWQTVVIPRATLAED